MAYFRALLLLSLNVMVLNALVLLPLASPVLLLVSGEEVVVIIMIGGGGNDDDLIG